MNKELLRHIEILKTVPEIKESIEELKFGCKVKEFRNYEDNNIFIYKLCRSFNSIDELITHIKVDTNKLLKVEIIGQVEERHLRMFCKENQISFNYGHNCLRLGIVGSGINTPRYSDSKPYMEQSEEFFKKLNDWICKEFSIDIN